MASRGDSKPRRHKGKKGRKGKKPPLLFRLGQWLPNDPKAEERFVEDLIKEIKSRRPLPYHPIIQDFDRAVENHPHLKMQYTQMFTEVTHSHSPTGKPQVRSYHQMFMLVNYIMQFYAPKYNKTDLVGFPINAILNWSMGTINGYAAFLNEEANWHWMKVLNQWGEFLKSPASTYVLVKDKDWGWFSSDALAAMPNFEEDFECDPTDEHYGFKSWDDFFVRKFREGRRPIAEGDNIIANACESHPYDLQYDVKLVDEFWAKEQPYSLKYMLGDDPLASKFENGTVYQAFLSALKYHRWHSPVDGKIVRAFNVPGTYYAASLEQGEDPASPNNSQGYICQIAARAVIFIEADNKKIGLMCFVGIGMAEVSTCEIRADLFPTATNPEPRVKKGEEIGMFHFGGSTHCLIFQPSVELEFESKVEYLLEHPKEDGSILINSKLATVVN